METRRQRALEHAANKILAANGFASTGLTLAAAERRRLAKKRARQGEARAAQKAARKRQRQAKRPGR